MHKHAMESNDQTITSKIKNKKGQKDKKIDYLLPLQFHRKPPIKIFPKLTNNAVIKSESDESDFPALPSYPYSSPDIKLNINTSTSFSTIVARKPLVSTNVKAERVLDINSKSSIENNNFVDEPVLAAQSCSSGRTTISNPSKSGKVLSASQIHKKSKVVTDSTKSGDFKNSGPNTTTLNSDQTSSKEVSKVNQVVKNEKRKKKSKKTSRTPQGKVNTLTQEQYRSFTEQNESKPTESAFPANIEDLCEYPELGVPLKNNVSTKKGISKLSNKQENTDASENDQIERRDTISISRLPFQEGSPLRKPLNVLKQEKESPKQEKDSPKQENTIPNKKFNAPIQMNLLDMLSKMKLTSNKTNVKFQTLNVKREKIISPGKHGTLNSLDSSGPTRKRGKEREVPRKPKLSKIKKVILKERVEKRLRLALLSMSNIKEEFTTECKNEINNNTGSLASEMQTLDHSDNESNETSSPTLPKEDSEPQDEVQVQVVNVQSQEEQEEIQKLKCAKKLLHCRKFREYCNHFISEEIDTLTNNLLSELVRYQDRLFLKDPVKARAKKRFVCGLREVTKNLKLRKLKLVIVAPDIEEINSEGGLNDALHYILNFCDNCVVPLMFSLPRRKLGKVCKKKVPLSCVGIFNYEGTEEIYKQLMELVEEARQVYKQTLTFAQQNFTDEMIQILCDDQVDHAKVEEMRILFWDSQANQ